MQAKLVRNHRGGYCFEQNLLFAAVLEQLGFQVTRLMARVRLGVQRLLPRTHMTLKVDAADESWLADVGYGREGLLQPVPWLLGRAHCQFGWQYRVIDEDGLFVLQRLIEEVWQDLYVCTLEPQLPIDYEVVNYYTSTHPNSVFSYTLTVQRLTPDARHALINREYTIVRKATMVSRTITEDGLLPLLAETFGLTFPSDTQFRAPIRS